MMAMFFAFWAVGSLDYSVINEAAGTLSATTATAIALFSFIGACGKSAQLPLYLWLPDAMEGPTPVSALIHAATMVTAGVYLMCRISPVLERRADYAGWIIAIVGAATALFAATIAVAQNDIKKVLAYSTVSQLGYMFLAVGSGAYTAAIFHMVTHAFFKALLFLGAGSVIHGMHHEQDMRRMGALRKLMPITAGTFIVGWLAIAGVPPFAGFWSKDEILLFAYDKSPVLWVVGLVTALLTAFYMTRQVIMVFYGKARWHDAHEEHGAHGDSSRRHAHESPWMMVFPLVVLAGAVHRRRLHQPAVLAQSTERLAHLARAGRRASHAQRHGEAAARARGDRRGARRHRRSRMPSTTSRQVKPVEPQILADAWGYDRAVSDFMGGPGRQAFDGVAWADAHIVDGAVNGAGALGARRPPARSARCRAATFATTRPQSAPASCCCSMWFVVVRGIL